MALSSLNFQKSKANSADETTRKFEADYLLPKEVRKENEYWNCGKTDAEVFNEELKIAKPKGGRKPKLQNSLWEGVLNLNENHKMSDVQKVAKLIEKKFNIKCTRIAIHKDEGKVFGTEENQKVKYNYHAHLNFVTYKDGRQNWRRQLIKRKDLSELQTEVAKILKMDRGKVGSTAVRANHRELRQNYDSIMEQRKAPELKLTVSALKQKISSLRDEMKQKNAELEKKNEQKIYTQADYMALNSLKKVLKKNNLQEIYQAFLKMQKELSEKKEKMQELEKEVYSTKYKTPNKEPVKNIAVVKHLEKKLTNALESKKELEIEISTLKQEKSEIEQSMDDIGLENSTLKTTNNTLQAKILKKDKQISSFIQKSEAIESAEVVQLKEKVQELEKKANYFETKYNKAFATLKEINQFFKVKSFEELVDKVKNLFSKEEEEKKSVEVDPEAWENLMAGTEKRLKEDSQKLKEN